MVSVPSAASHPLEDRYWKLGRWTSGTGWNDRCRVVVVVGDSALCCCGPAFNVMCDVNCSSAITSHCLLLLVGFTEVVPTTGATRSSAAVSKSTRHAASWKPSRNASFARAEQDPPPHPASPQPSLACPHCNRSFRARIGLISHQSPHSQVIVKSWSSSQAKDEHHHHRQ